ncbi:MAG TPA: response regulator [Vicinamibacteria bacterium]
MNRTSTVLIVDHEKNIRTTLARALESIGLVAETAATAEEALDKLSASPFELMLLDLWLPEVDGLELLRRAREMRPEMRVVVVTAHGTVEAAVRAMKLGAMDFVQKPFSPEEIRDVVRAALDAGPPAAAGGDYDELVAEARHKMESRHLEAAMPCIRKAIGVDPGRPEAFNLLGVATARRGKTYRAQDYFRASLALDPTYAPALMNLERCGTIPSKGELVLGNEEESR